MLLFNSSVTNPSQQWKRRYFPTVASLSLSLSPLPLHRPLQNQAMGAEKWAQSSEPLGTFNLLVVTKSFHCKNYERTKNTTPPHVCQSQPLRNLCAGASSLSCATPHPERVGAQVSKLLLHAVSNLVLIASEKRRRQLSSCDRTLFILL